MLFVTCSKACPDLTFLTVLVILSYRAKYHRLKYGTDVSPEKANKEEENANQEPHKDGTTNNTKPGMNWRQGRQLLRQ